MEIRLRERSEARGSGTFLQSLRDPLLAALVTAAIYWLVMLLGDYVPFGINTPAVTDAKLQYLDLFAYYRDVLTGQNSAVYTFSNTLGGGAAAIWAYYLASPFNLLVLLFEKDRMNLFLEVLITVKLSAASAAFAWFIGRRFRGRLRGGMTLLLSVSYGLMQYMTAQGSNVMWLDGVILLPFIVLGVHKIVRTSGMSERRSAVLALAIPAALSVIANWYTGGINYLFSFVWLVYEAARGQGVGKRAESAAGSGSKANAKIGGTALCKNRGPARKFGDLFLRYIAGMGLGLLLASFLFVPNVLALRLGKGAAWNPAAAWDAASAGVAAASGSAAKGGAVSGGAAPGGAASAGDMSYGGAMSAGLRGNPFTVLRSYRIGEISDSSRVSFFCGSLALFGTVAFFCSGRIKKRDKAAGAGLLLFTVMSVFWQPLFVLFSLFQYSNSYWYRYGYLGSFVLLYLAAYWAGSLSGRKDSVTARDSYVNYGTGSAAGGDKPMAARTPSMRGRAAERRQVRVIIEAGAISVLLILVSQRIWPSGGMRSTRIAVLALVGITALLLVPRRTASATRAAAIALAMLCIGEMFLQTRAMLGIYHTDTAEEYAAYSRQEQEQIEGLLSFDQDGFYRVNQTSTRIGNKDGLTAAYLDAMAYGYASVSGYTSCPENIQLEFLDRIGYRKEYESFNIVNTSFLPADSLLGVRYVLSVYEIPGLRDVKELGLYNGKTVFENPFVLPVAMIVEEGVQEDSKYSAAQENAEKKQVSTEREQDPFAYLEQIYGELSGQEAGLFVPVTAERNYSGGKTEWTLTVPDGNYCLYGNLPWKEAMEGRLMVSEDWGFGYGGWLSPSVFYIPVPEEENSEGGEEAVVAEEAGIAESGESFSEADSSAEANAKDASKTVRVTLETRGEPQLLDEQFYALDLDRLSEVCAQIRARSSAVRDLAVANGKVSCSVDVAEGQSLVLSVPASKGWTAFVNGKKTPIDTYEGCLVKIPLAQGENHITMQYRVPGMAAGIVMTLIGAAACFAMMLAGGRRGI